MNEVAQQKPWPLYIIVGSVFGVMLMGWLLSPNTEESKLAWIDLLGTTNHGVLLNPPLEVEVGQLVDPEGNQWAALDDNSWKLLLFSPEVCAQQCLARLQEMHAMRLRLNRDMGRLSIGLVLPKDAPLPTETLTHDIHLLRLESTDLIASLDATNVSGWKQGGLLALMNPIDVFMMAYTPEHSGIEILEDFEHLLDLSQ